MKRKIFVLLVIIVVAVIPLFFCQKPKEEYSGVREQIKTESMIQ